MLSGASSRRPTLIRGVVRRSAARPRPRPHTVGGHRRPEPFDSRNRSRRNEPAARRSRTARAWRRRSLVPAAAPEQHRGRRADLHEHSRVSVRVGRQQDDRSHGQQRDSGFHHHPLRSRKFAKAMPGKIRKKMRGNLDLYEAPMTFEPDTLSIASDASRLCRPGARLSEEKSRQGMEPSMARGCTTCRANLASGRSITRQAADGRDTLESSHGFRIDPMSTSGDCRAWTGRRRSSGTRRNRMPSSVRAFLRRIGARARPARRRAR